MFFVLHTQDACAVWIYVSGFHLWAWEDVGSVAKTSLTKLITTVKMLRFYKINHGGISKSYQSTFVAFQQPFLRSAVQWLPGSSMKLPCSGLLSSSPSVQYGL